MPSKTDRSLPSQAEREQFANNVAVPVVAALSRVAFGQLTRPGCWSSSRKAPAAHSSLCRSLVRSCDRPASRTRDHLGRANLPCTSSSYIVTTTATTSASSSSSCSRFCLSLAAVPFRTDGGAIVLPVPTRRTRILYYAELRDVMYETEKRERERGREGESSDVRSLARFATGGFLTRVNRSRDFTRALMSRASRREIRVLRLINFRLSLVELSHRFLSSHRNFYLYHPFVHHL